MKYLRFASLSLLAAVAAIGTIAGGAWQWVGLIIAVAVASGADTLLGDNTDEPKYRHVWLLNAMLYSALPVVIAYSVVVAWSLSTRDVFGLGAAVSALTGFDAIAARDATSLIHHIGGGLGLGLFYGGAATVVAHELTHRTSSRSALIVGRWLLAFTADASFSIEHVYGHHKHVATRRDPATSRRGESSWAFVVRSTLGAFQGACRLENARLRRRGASKWGLRSRIVRGALMTAVYAAFFAWAAGWVGLVAYVLIAAYGKVYLEMINYVEHYGMVRVPGRPVEPRHSWNCNRRVSSALLYNLTRHSHHHAMGEKPFWELRPYADSPMLPYGYLTMIIVALVPPAWERMMVPRVLEWDRHFASEAERTLIDEANAASGLSAFTDCTNITPHGANNGGDHVLEAAV